LTLRFPRNATTRDAKVQYVEQASDTNMCGRSEVRGLADSCTAKEVELNNKSNECSTKQKTFEVAFCSWKAQLESNCEALETCHSAAVTAYDRHVNKTQPLVEKWDAETATLHKILCYCNTWLREMDAGDNRSQHNATQFEACKASTHTRVPMNYGTAPEKVACLLTSVANYPGTSGFVTQEYSLFADFIQGVLPCPSTPIEIDVQYNIIIGSLAYYLLISNDVVKAELTSAIKEALLSSLPDGYTADDITVTFSDATPTNATVLIDTGSAAGMAMDTARAKNVDAVNVNIAIKPGSGVSREEIKEWCDKLEQGSGALNAQMTDCIQAIAHLQEVVQDGMTTDNVVVDGKAS